MKTYPKVDNSVSVSAHEVHHLQKGCIIIVRDRRPSKGLLEIH